MVLQAGEMESFIWGGILYLMKAETVQLESTGSMFNKYAWNRLCFNNIHARF